MGDLDRIRFGGKIIDRRTSEMLTEAQRLAQAEDPPSQRRCRRSRRRSRPVLGPFPGRVALHPSRCDASHARQLCPPYISPSSLTPRPACSSIKSQRLPGGSARTASNANRAFSAHQGAFRSRCRHRNSTSFSSDSSQMPFSTSTKNPSGSRFRRSVMARTSCSRSSPPLSVMPATRYARTSHLARLRQR
jgi:hypothetical protein